MRSICTWISNLCSLSLRGRNILLYNIYTNSNSRLTFFDRCTLDSKLLYRGHGLRYHDSSQRFWCISRNTVLIGHAKTSKGKAQGNYYHSISVKTPPRQDITVRLFTSPFAWSREPDYLTTFCKVCAPGTNALIFTSRALVLQLDSHSQTHSQNAQPDEWSCLSRRMTNLNNKQIYIIA